MTQSAQIAAALLGLAAAVAFASGTPHLRNRRTTAAGTGFHTDDPAAPPAECEGTCPGGTEHEDVGDGTATCPGCGTPRQRPVPDAA